MVRLFLVILPVVYTSEVSEKTEKTKQNKNNMFRNIHLKQQLCLILPSH